MKEYNELTKKLLAEGDSAEQYPNYVKICSSKLSGNDPLNNLSGGFIYEPALIRDFVYKTGCGIYVRGSHVHTGMAYMGVEWSHENDCPLIRCPYDKPDCPHNDERLHGVHGGGLLIQCHCVCHRTAEEYDYTRSYEMLEKERQAECERKYQEYVKSHSGRVCRNHMYFNERTRSWNQIYEPKQCARFCYSTDGYCPILGKQLSKKRGNIYYDLKTSGTCRDDTIFNGERWTNIQKGMRYFDHPVCMDICEAFIKYQPDVIFEKWKWEKLSYMRLFDHSYELEVLNIRAESRPSRDLQQDLEDIKAGITVTHASDIEKAKKEGKKQRRQKARQDRIRKLEKKILEVGYENLEEYSLDKVHADKWLTRERLDELEEERLHRIVEENTQPKQMELFQFIEDN